MVYANSAGYEICFEENVDAEMLGRSYVTGARVFREYEPGTEESTMRCLVTITDYTGTWPDRFDLALVLPQLRGFSPGVLIVPETKIAFIGSLDVIVAYRLETCEEIWEDVIFGGFWGWNRSGDVVLMQGELEFIAFDLHAAKKWSTPVEPVWGYKVKDNTVHLDVMDKLSSFPLETGPVR
jgi:hypothetical protein